MTTASTTVKNTGKSVDFINQNKIQPHNDHSFNQNLVSPSNT
jgi:hypothetical protein